MNQRNRLALLGAGLLIVILAGGALASQLPRSQQPSDLAAEESDAPPTADELAHAVDRLAANGIETDEAALADLASRYGLGGAVRLMAWSNETGMSVDELAAKRDSGQGWGQIAKELGVHPGIGSIMGNGGGHGREGAPGQNKPDASATE
jgi:hypothetical protein